MAVFVFSVVKVRRQNGRKIAPVKGIYTYNRNGMSKGKTICTSLLFLIIAFLNFFVSLL